MSKLDRFKRKPVRQARLETDAEQTLWDNLDRIPIEGSHFRRQVEIGPFRSDFGSLRLRLLVEVDGPIHADAAHRRRDAQRTGWPENEGYRVIRFSNHQVTTDMNGVLAAIRQAIAEQTAIHGHPTPALRADPPPQGEGGARATDNDLTPAQSRRPSP